MSVELPLFSARFTVREGSTTLVDDEIADEIGERRLSLCTGYVFFNSRPLHRHVMGCVPRDGNVVHHINEDPTDNRRANLLVVGSEKEHAALPHPWRQRICELVGVDDAAGIIARERVAAGLRPIGGHGAVQLVPPNLRALRNLAGAQQEQVAAAMGLSVRTYIRHENGETPLSGLHRRAYAVYFGVDPESIEQPERQAA